VGGRQVATIHHTHHTSISISIRSSIALLLILRHTASAQVQLSSRESQNSKSKVYTFTFTFHVSTPLLRLQASLCVVCGYLCYAAIPIAYRISGYEDVLYMYLYRFLFLCVIYCCYGLKTTPTYSLLTTTTVFSKETRTLRSRPFLILIVGCSL
jgi:hypothetical protein